MGSLLHLLTLFYLSILFHRGTVVEGCSAQIAELFNRRPSAPTGSTTIKPPTFDEVRRAVAFDEPLFYGKSVREMLSLCPERLHPLPTVAQMTVSADIREKLSTCDHQVDPLTPGSPTRKMKNIELFLLREAQQKFKRQEKVIKNSWRAAFSTLMFIIPLLMAIYLIMIKHFYIGNLPILYRFCEPRPDKTEGVKYNVFTWMKVRILPGSHPEGLKTTVSFTSKRDSGTSSVEEDAIKSKKPEKIKWCKYNKDDEILDPKQITIDYQKTKFRFRDRIDVTKFLDDDTLAGGSHALEDGHGHSHPHTGGGGKKGKNILKTGLGI